MFYAPWAISPNMTFSEGSKYLPQCLLSADLHFNGGIDRLILFPCESDWFKIHPNHCNSGERVLEIRLPLSLLKANCKQGIWSTDKANRSAF